MNALRAFLLITGFVLCCQPAMAQEIPPAGDMPQDKPAHHHEGRGGGSCCMMGGKGGMKGMHGKDLNAIATYDGGLVLIGHGKMVKYDKDMNVVKEIILDHPPAPVEKEADQPPQPADVPVESSEHIITDTTDHAIRP